MSAQERTGFRDDLDLSRRHRTWGFDVPAANVDMLMVEYDLGLPRALIEYKHELSRFDFTHWAQESHMLATARLRGWRGEELPYLGVRYYKRPGQWKFDVWFLAGPLRWPNRWDVTELEYVALLYRIRGREIPRQVANQLRALDQQAAS